MSEPTTDFGAPAAFGKRHFYVDIPRSPQEPVAVFEDFGYEDAEESGGQAVVCRLVLARELWGKIRDEARRDFNARLKAKDLSVGSWRPGTVKLDRFLGRELCVLGWAAELASADECPIICRKWVSLRPEERWWLYAKTAAEAGLDGESGRGWRKALYCALSDGEGIKLAAPNRNGTKRGRAAQAQAPTFFDFMERGNI